MVGHSRCGSKGCAARNFWPGERPYHWLPVNSWGHGALARRKARMFSRGLVAGFACLVGIVACVLVLRDSGETDRSPEQRVVDAAVARIAAESREALPEPHAQAIPKLPRTEAVPDRPEMDFAAVAAGGLFVRRVRRRHAHCAHAGSRADTAPRRRPGVAELNDCNPGPCRPVDCGGASLVLWLDSVVGGRESG